MAWPRHDDFLELDEVCGSVGKRANKGMDVDGALPTDAADCRLRQRRPQRGHLQEALGRIPKAYRACRTFSDFWAVYASVFLEGRRQSVDKETGGTAHMERWNNTLRQRVERMVRKTLWFSKDVVWHDGVIHWFVISYNDSLSFNF